MKYNKLGTGIISWKKYIQKKPSSKYSETETITATFDEIKDWDKRAILVMLDMKDGLSGLEPYTISGNTVSVVLNKNMYKSPNITFIVIEFVGRVKVYRGTKFLKKANEQTILWGIKTENSFEICCVNRAFNKNTGSSASVTDVTVTLFNDTLVINSKASSEAMNMACYNVIELL